jgi:hypothetical protein
LSRSGSGRRGSAAVLGGCTSSWHAFVSPPSFNVAALSRSRCSDHLPVVAIARIVSVPDSVPFPACRRPTAARLVTADGQRTLGLRPAILPNRTSVRRNCASEDLIAAKIKTLSCDAARACHSSCSARCPERKKCPSQNAPKRKVSESKTPHSSQERRRTAIPPAISQLEPVRAVFTRVSPARLQQ